MQKAQQPVEVCEPTLAAHPALIRLLGDIDLLSTFSFEAAEKSFAAFSRSPFVREALHALLTRINNDDSFQLSRFTQEGNICGFTLFSTEKFSASLGVIGNIRATSQAPKSAERIGSTISPQPADTFTHVVAALDVTRTSYSLLDDSPLPRISQATVVEVRAGDEWSSRSGKDIATYLVRGAYIYLEFASTPTTALMPLFDDLTLTHSGWRSGDVTSSRLELLTRTLAELRYRKAVPQLLGLTGHRDHFVRWNTIRHLLRIDPIAGRACVIDAQSDQHPHVRNAAMKTMHILNQQAA